MHHRHWKTSLSNYLCLLDLVIRLLENHSGARRQFKLLRGLDRSIESLSAHIGQVLLQRILIILIFITTFNTSLCSEQHETRLLAPSALRIAKLTSPHQLAAVRSPAHLPGRNIEPLLLFSLALGYIEATRERNFHHCRTSWTPHSLELGQRSFVYSCKGLITTHMRDPSIRRRIVFGHRC